MGFPAVGEHLAGGGVSPEVWSLGIIQEDFQEEAVQGESWNPDAILEEK